MEEIYTFGLDDGGSPTLLVAALADGEAVPQAQREKVAARRQDVTRRRDAVVDAARTLEDLSPAGVEEHVRRRWRGVKVLEQSDIDSFSADATAQRVHDVVDALDSRVRRSVFGRTKHASVSMPRGWIRRALRAMSADEVSELTQRLASRGWDADQIKRSMKTYRREVAKS